MDGQVLLVSQTDCRILIRLENRTSWAEFVDLEKQIGVQNKELVSH